MEGALHLLALLSLAAGTGLTCFHWFEVPTGRRALVAALAPVAVLIPAWLLSVHACDAGIPLTQLLVSWGCLVALCLFVAAPRIRLLAASIVGVAMLALSVHYGTLVHGSDWVGAAASMAAAGPAEAQWHTPVSGLYRRSGG